MKIWLLLKNILEPLATQENMMEVLDINLSILTQPHFIEMMRMQDIQKEINQIKQNVCAKKYGDSEITKKREEMDKLEERFNKIKIKYNNFTK